MCEFHEKFIFLNSLELHKVFLLLCGGQGGLFSNNINFRFKAFHLTNVLIENEYFSTSAEVAGGKFSTLSSISVYALGLSVARVTLSRSIRCVWSK